MASLGLDTSLILYLVAAYACSHHLDEVVALKAAWKRVTLRLIFFPRIWRVWLDTIHSVCVQNLYSLIQHFFPEAGDVELGSSVVVRQLCRLT